VANTNVLTGAMHVVNAKLLEPVGFGPVQIVKDRRDSGKLEIFGCVLHTNVTSLTSDSGRLRTFSEQARAWNPENRIRLSDLEKQLLTVLRNTRGVAHTTASLSQILSRNSTSVRWTDMQIKEAMGKIFTVRDEAEGIFADIAVSKGKNGDWLFGSVVQSPENSVRKSAPQAQNPRKQ
jgi:hypothetical protein